MKRIIAIVCLLAITVLMLASCGVNFEAMKSKLEKNDYEVTYVTKAMIEKNDTSELSTTEKMIYASIETLVSDSSVKGVLIGVNTKNLFDIKTVAVIEFESEDDAKECAEALGEEAVRSGKVVYMGDEDSIKIVK